MASSRRYQPAPADPSLETRVSVALEHLKLMIESEGDELHACRHLRGQIPMYIKGEFGASALRDRLTRCSAYSEYEELLYGFVEQVRGGELASA